MARVTEQLQGKIMSAAEAASQIRTGMTLGMSGFTGGGYPKAIPTALIESGHAKELTILIGASSGAELDGAMARAGLIKKRFSYQSEKDMRDRINAGEIGFGDIHISQFPRLLNQGAAPKIDLAVIEATAIREEGIIPTGAVGATDAVIRAADRIIVEINQTIPETIEGIHDIFEIGNPPNARIIPILHATDRVGLPYIPCPPEKITAIVMTDKADPPAKFKEVTPATKAIGEHITEFLVQEQKAGRLPKEMPPLQSGVGSVGNAVLQGIAASGLRGMQMYTEVMQDAALRMLEDGVFTAISTSALSLTEEGRERFYEKMDWFRERIVIRPQEISNHPEVIRRLGVIALNTPIEADIYGNVNSTHIMGSSIMNGLGGSGDYARSAALTIFATESTAKNGKISCIVPMVSHVDHTEHDVQVLVTEQGVADLRWTTPRERAKLIIENCAHPDYRPQLLEYVERAEKKAYGLHTPHDLETALSWHQRYLQTGTMRED